MQYYAVKVGDKLIELITYTAQDTVHIVIDIILLTKKKLDKHPLQSYINQ